MLNPDTPSPLQVYHKDVTQRLRDSRMSALSDIEWLRVVRFYEEGEVVGAGVGGGGGQEG